MMKVLVCYNDNECKELHKTVQFELPKKWQMMPKSDLLRLFLKTYNDAPVGEKLLIDSVQFARYEMISVSNTERRKEYIPLKYNEPISWNIKNGSTMYVRHIDGTNVVRPKLKSYVPYYTNTNKSDPKLTATFSNQQNLNVTADQRDDDIGTQTRASTKATATSASAAKILQSDSIDRNNHKLQSIMKRATTTPVTNSETSNAAAAVVASSSLDSITRTMQTTNAGTSTNNAVVDSDSNYNYDLDDDDRSHKSEISIVELSAIKDAFSKLGLDTTYFEKAVKDAKNEICIAASKVESDAIVKSKIGMLLQSSFMNSAVTTTFNKMATNSTSTGTTTTVPPTSTGTGTGTGTTPNNTSTIDTSSVPQSVVAPPPTTTASRAVSPPTVVVEQSDDASIGNSIARSVSKFLGITESFPTTVETTASTDATATAKEEEKQVEAVSAIDRASSTVDCTVPIPIVQASSTVEFIPDSSDIVQTSSSVEFEPGMSDLGSAHHESRAAVIVPAIVEKEVEESNEYEIYGIQQTLSNNTARIGGAIEALITNTSQGDEAVVLARSNGSLVSVNSKISKMSNIITNDTSHVSEMSASVSDYTMNRFSTNTEQPVMTTMMMTTPRTSTEDNTMYEQVMTSATTDASAAGTRNTEGESTIGSIGGGCQPSDNFISDFFTTLFRKMVFAETPSTSTTTSTTNAANGTSNNTRTVQVVAEPTIDNNENNNNTEQYSLTVVDEIPDVASAKTAELQVTQTKSWAESIKDMLQPMQNDLDDVFLPKVSECVGAASVVEACIDPTIVLPLENVAANTSTSTTIVNDIIETTNTTVTREMGHTSAFETVQEQKAGTQLSEKIESPPVEDKIELPPVGDNEETLIMAPVQPATVEEIDQIQTKELPKEGSPTNEISTDITSLEVGRFQKSVSFSADTKFDPEVDGAQDEERQEDTVQVHVPPVIPLLVGDGSQVGNNTCVSGSIVDVCRSTSTVHDDNDDDDERDYEEESGIELDLDEVLGEIRYHESMKKKELEEISKQKLIGKPIKNMIASLTSAATTTKTNMKTNTNTNTQPKRKNFMKLFTASS